MRLSKEDKAEIRELLHKISEQINVIEMQCDNVMENMAKVWKDLDLNEGEQYEKNM